MRLASCVLHANVYAYARQQTTLWENDQNRNFLTLGAALFHEKWRICEEYMTTKTHRRKMYAAMECESVEISGSLQVRFELWSFEKFWPQKRALIDRTLYLRTEEESYIGLKENMPWCPCPFKKEASPYIEGKLGQCFSLKIEWHKALNQLLHTVREVKHQLFSGLIVKHMCPSHCLKSYYNHHLMPYPILLRLNFFLNPLGEFSMCCTGTFLSFHHMDPKSNNKKMNWWNNSTSTEL